MPTSRLVAALEMPRSTVVRLIDGMTDIDLLTMLPNGAPELSPRWLALSDAAGTSMKEWDAARQAMRRLSDTTSRTTTLSVYQDGKVTCLDWAPGKDFEVLQAKPGRSLPLHAGADGRSILSGLPTKELAKVLDRAPFEAYTSNTMSTAEELTKDIALSRSRGYTLSLNDAWLGVGAIATLVRDPIRKQLGTITLSSTSDEVLVHSDGWCQALADATEGLERLAGK